MSRRKYKAPINPEVSTNPLRARHQLLRRQIACAAAKLLAEDGLSDYLTAKTKAARRLACDAEEALPDDSEIKAALREHLALFQIDSQPRELREIRMVAVTVMRQLKQFAPQLRGAVLDGTANRFSSIDLALVVEHEKALDLFLLTENICYETRLNIDRRRKKKRQIYEFLIEGVKIFATVFISTSERAQHAIVDGIKGPHAELVELETLLQTRN